MKRLLPIAAAAAAAAALTLPLALPHLRDHGGSVGASGSFITLARWQDPGPSAGLAVRQKADDLFTSFSGTAFQQDALAVVHAYQGNSNMDACMSAAGHPEWDWSLSRTYAARQDPLETSLWLQMPMARIRSHRVVALKPFSEAEVVMNGPETLSFDDAVTKCLTPDNLPPAKHVYGDAVARSVEQLQQAWWDFTAKFEASMLPDPKVYEDCMLNSNITMVEPLNGDSFETMMGYAMSHITPPDKSIPADVTDPQQWNDPAWQTFLGLEDEFYRADWTCRQGVYTQHIDDLDAAIDQFAAQYAPEIDQAHQYWLDIEAQARALGYTGQTGSLEGVVGASPSP